MGLPRLRPGLATHKVWGGILLLGGLFALFTSTTFAMNESISVALVRYSGKPDPHWTITEPAKINFIKRSLQRLPRVEQPNWPPLGWRGYMLTAQSGTPLNGIVRVFHGVICVKQEDQQQCYRDVHNLEKWLHSEAVAQGLQVPDQF